MFLNFELKSNPKFRSHHPLIDLGFCRASTFNCEPSSSEAPSYCHSPSSTCSSLSSNSPLPHNNQQTTVNSPRCYSNAHPTQQQNYPLTPASTSSVHSPQCCTAPSACSPLLINGLYSPETPNSNYWLFSTTSLVPEVCDWQQFIDEIIEDVRGEIRNETVIFKFKSNC